MNKNNKGGFYMKYIIASDIHGSSYYTKKLKNIILSENPDKVILLGDIYYHGPRNKLPKQYNPMKVSEQLNSFGNKIICVKGNCDAEVDEMISNFKFKEFHTLEICKKSVLCVHGHKLDKNNPPQGFDLIFSGHTHIASIKKINNIIFVNPGSLSIPKGKEKMSYAIIDDNRLTIRELNGKIIDSINF